MMFRNYPNERLLAELRQTYGSERSSVVRVIRLLEEVDRRRLYAELGYSTLHGFCLDVLNLSEHEAALRIAVARSGRRFGLIFEMIERGELHLTGAAMVARYLTPENHRALLEAARRKTKQQIAELIAEWFPKPDEPTSIRRLPAPGPAAVPQPERAHELPLLSLAVAATPGKRSLGAPMASAPTPAGPRNDPLPVAAPTVVARVQPQPPPPPAVSRPGVVMPLAVDRYSVKFTASRRCRDLIEKAKALMSHRAPNADVGEVVETALEVLVEQLEKKKFKKTDRPRSRPDEPAKSETRRPSAAVQRAVAARDGERCTYVSPDGRRCEEKRFLEFDHVEAAALGGPATVDNLRLRCRTHNGLTARQQFGDAYVDLRAAGFRPSSVATTASTRAPGGDRRARSDANERLELFD